MAVARSSSGVVGSRRASGGNTGSTLGVDARRSVGCRGWPVRRA